MKRKFGLTLVVLLLSAYSVVSAQVKLGVRGGLNMTEMSFNNVLDNFDSSNRVGFFIGPTVDFKIPLVGFGVDASLLFSKKDAKVAFNNESKTFSEKGIDIPINLKYNLGLSSLAAIYLAAGPNFFFNLDKGYNLEGVSFDKKKAQIGFNLGGGLRFLRHYQLGVNYNIPITKSADTNLKSIGGDFSETGSYKSKTWQVAFSYYF